MPSVHEDSLRDLLESALPVEHRVAIPAAEVRRRGDRRRRRGYALGAGAGVAAIAVASVLGAQVLAGVRTGPDRDGVVAVTPTPSPSRSLDKPAVRALEGTRWIPDLVAFNAVGNQLYPDEKGSAARALLTFEKEGVLVVDVMQPGRPVVTLRGTWEAGSTDPALTPALRADVRLSLVAPEGSTDAVAGLVSRLSIVRTAAGYQSDGPPASLTGLTLWLYADNGNSLTGALDLVKPDAVLPAPYPSRP